VAARDERLAGNEALFREVNERVAEVATHLLEADGDGGIHFTCECGHAGCTEPMLMSLVEYGAIRSRATRFAVVPGHEEPEIENVVERHPNYLVVDKYDEDAQEIARETDPRA
jgi:hypothetical protein